MKALPAPCILAAILASRAIAFGEPEVGGIGLVLQVDESENTLVVAKALPNSPAAKAGIAADVVIVAIDFFPAKGKTLEQCVDLIRGQIGTTVNIDVLDPKTGKLTHYELIREKLNVLN